MRRGRNKGIFRQYKYQIYGVLTVGVLAMLSKSNLSTQTTTNNAMINEWFFHFFGLEVAKKAETTTGE